MSLECGNKNCSCNNNDTKNCNCNCDKNDNRNCNCNNSDNRNCNCAKSCQSNSNMNNSQSDFSLAALNNAWGMNNDTENNMCGCNNDTREHLLKQIKCYNFAIVELALYLDTHPDDEKALCLHNKYCKEYKDLTDKYQKVYGPLTITYPCNKWRWLEEPWPWEGGMN